MIELDDNDIDDLDDLDDLDDVWAADEYGYADMTLIGTDTWEDQAGMEDLKKSLKIPNDWFLIKVVNFSWTGDRSLKAIDEWLQRSCRHPYRRVGWSSNCTTKVGVAFSSAYDATLFKLKWR